MKLENFTFVETLYIGIFYFLGMIAYLIVGLACAGLILGWISARDSYFPKEKEEDLKPSSP